LCLIVEDFTKIKEIFLSLALKSLAKDSHRSSADVVIDEDV